MADGAYGGMATFKQAGFQDRFQEKNMKVNRVMGLIKSKTKATHRESELWLPSALK